MHIYGKFPEKLAHVHVGVPGLLSPPLEGLGTRLRVYQLYDTNMCM